MAKVCVALLQPRVTAIAYTIFGVSWMLPLPGVGVFVSLRLLWGAYVTHMKKFHLNFICMYMHRLTCIIGILR